MLLDDIIIIFLACTEVKISDLEIAPIDRTCDAAGIEPKNENMRVLSFSFLEYTLKRASCFISLTPIAKSEFFGVNLKMPVASWLVRLTPERAVWVRVLAGDVVSCCWARHFTLTVPLSTQMYIWVPANLMLRCKPAMD